MLPVERALFVTGLISSFCSFIGAISVLVSLPRVIRSQDLPRASRMKRDSNDSNEIVKQGIRTQESSSIPGLLVAANLLSSFVWCICGWMLADPLIAAPNVIGCLSGGLSTLGSSERLGVLCLLLKYVYPESSVKPRADSEPMTRPARPMKAISYQSCDTGGTF